MKADQIGMSELPQPMATWPANVALKNRSNDHRFSMIRLIRMLTNAAPVPAINVFTTDLPIAKSIEFIECFVATPPKFTKM